jgi:hypothetical protein
MAKASKSVAKVGKKSDKSNSSHFKKGERRVGRAPNTPNRVTRISQEAIAAALEGSSEKIRQALEALENRPRDYIDAIVKLLPYVVPKKYDVTTDGKTITGIQIVDVTQVNNNTQINITKHDS